MADAEHSDPESPSKTLQALESDGSGPEDNGIDEEQITKEWLTATYVPGSKKPMKMPLKDSWDLSISDSDVEKIKAGFKSRDMDDKWDLLVEHPDPDGNLSLHILRSWLQEECYVLHIVPVAGAAKIQSITWEGNKGGLQCGAEQAKKEAVMVARSKLHCEFETLPDYPLEVMWDSKAYKKLDA